MKTKLLLAATLLPLSLYASKILSYNIYDRTDRVDMMLTFDTPYSGRISQSKSDKKIIIKLQDATIEAPKIKQVASSFVQSLTLTPLNNTTEITALLRDKNVRFIASKTTDGYGLRLRFTPKAAAIKQNTLTQNQKKQSNTPDLSALPTQKDLGISNNYYIVMAILVAGVAVLLYLRKKIPTVNKKESLKKESWLFAQQNTSLEQQSSTPTENKTEESQVSIRFQKALDENNTVIMLDFGKQSYLILMGNGNILLDKFYDDKPESQQEFEAILQERHQELNSFLHGNPTTTPTNTPKEALQSYKERAASLLYSENA